MGLINGTAFEGLVRAYRLLWIGGRFSGGKTSLVYRLAYPLLKDGYRFVTNNRTVWADNLEDVQLLDTGHLRAIVVLDEGGLSFKHSRQVEEICAYAAKMDCVYIISSFFPPTRAAQVLSCQPLFGLRSAGIPLIVYKWAVNLGQFRDSGTFAWWRPDEVWGLYSRQDPGSDCEEIVDFLIRRKDEFRAFHGRDRGGDDGGEEDSIPAVETDRRESETSAVSDLLEASQEMAWAASQYQTLPGRGGRRWRRRG